MDNIKNREFNLYKIQELNKKLNYIYKIDENKLKYLKDKGKLSARQRIDILLDKNDSIEIAPFAGYEMYKNESGCKSGGVIVKIGYIHKTLCIIVANDYSVKAGSWFPITCKKVLRAQEISIQNQIPIIYLVDSAGIFLPLQDEIFPDKYGFGRIFRNNSIMSSMGIIQIAAIMGDCVAGGAYLPIMCDESIIVNKTGTIFLAGNHLVKAAIGEIIDNETLGGAESHSKISGIVDYVVKNDIEALKKIRKIIHYISPKKTKNINNFNKITSFPPQEDVQQIYEILPTNINEQYNMYEIIKRLVDNSIIEEYKSEYGKTIICCYARIDGWSVGIIANQRKMVKSNNEGIQIGGVIYSDSAQKAARFILNCNQKKIPLIFLQDVTGFMVGSKSEHKGIIKDGAKLLNAISNSIVPKFTIIIGNSYGAGNYAMCGKAYDPNLILCWPNAKIAVMGDKQASNVLWDIKNKRNINDISNYEEIKFKENIRKDLEYKSSCYYAAARLWIDNIIDPLETRKYISIGIEMANKSKISETFNLGIIQT